MTAADKPPDGFQVNPGYCPTDAERPGTRVEVILRNGEHPDPNANGSGYPHGWAANGKGRCRWSKPGRPHDIAFYRVLGA